MTRTRQRTSEERFGGGWISSRGVECCQLSIRHLSATIMRAHAHKHEWSMVVCSGWMCHWCLGGSNMSVRCPQDSSKLVATQGDPGLLDEFFMGKWDMMLPSNVPAAYVCCTRFTFGMLSMCTGQVFQPLSLPSQTI